MNPIIFIGLVLITKLAWWAAFKLPVVQEMHQWNRTEDKPKKALSKYKAIRKQIPAKLTSG